MALVTLGARRAAPITAASRGGAQLKRAREWLEDSYSLLPADYFHDKDARRFRFHTVTRLVERDDRRVEETTEPRVEQVLASELARAASTGLYVGVPWCAQICAFCNFAYSTSIDPSVHDAYLAALARELALVRAAGLARTSLVYFGGGTPTVLDDARFAGYLRDVLGRLDLLPNASVTCEATISTLSDAKLAIMRERGVTRLSMGVQSLDDGVRERARLIGTRDEVLRTLDRARGVFDMFNVDLIYGYPDQTEQSWYETVRAVAELGLPSITLYRLEVKDRTTNLKLFRSQRAQFQDELTARLHYFIAAVVLEDLGYVEHPLGWWIRNDRHAGSQTWKQHMAGWSTAAPYLGIGQGAFSLGASLYHRNHESLHAWRAAIDAGRLPVEARYALSPRDAYVHRLLRTLRTARYLHLDAARAEIATLGAAAHGLAEALTRVLERQIELGLMEYVEGTYWLTAGGRSLVHWILDEIVDAALASGGAA